MLNGTFTSSGTPPKPLDKAEIERWRKELESMPVPEGLVLLPNGSGFDVYQFPVALLKGAISLMRLQGNPFNFTQQHVTGLEDSTQTASGFR